MSVRPPLITIRGDTSLVLNRSTTRSGSPATKPLQIFLSIHKVDDGEDRGWDVEVATGKKDNVIAKISIGSYDSGETGDFDPWFLPDNCAAIKLPAELDFLKNQHLVVFSSYMNEDDSLQLEVESDYLTIDPTPPDSPQ